MNPIQFKPEPEPTRDAIAASFDLAGFTAFCERADGPALVNRYLSRLFEAFDQQFADPWRDYFTHPGDFVQVRRPDFSKFTGDGALLLWFREEEQDFNAGFRTAVIQALRQFQQQLPEKVAGWERQWNVSSLPKEARIGITSGGVQPLRATATRIFSESVDYAGPCINRALRLQNHCPAVGFIVDASLQPELTELISLTALLVKGLRNEPVYLFQEDFHRATKTAAAQVEGKFSV